MKYLAGALILLASAVGMCVVSTIPPAPDPATLPSSVLESPSPSFEGAVAEGRSIARTLLAEEKLPGLSVAVAVDGDIVWAEGFRWADMENETPITPTTLLRIGGVSETITAAAAGLLVDRGRLDLDAPVQHYLPDFPEKEWPVSTRQLMAHAAGLRPYRGDSGIFRGDSCSSDAGRIAFFADEPLRTRPGTVVRYSTFNGSLVGAVIGAAAGESYLDFVRREILAPLGMDHTTPDVAGQTVPGSAHFYYPRLALDPRYGLQDSPEVDLSCHLPAVGFLSTPSDLARLASAMMSDGLLSPGTVEQLLTPVPVESDPDNDRALGWSVSGIPLGVDAAPTRVAGHGLGDVVVLKPLSASTVGGQVAGGTAALIIVPEYRVAVAVVSNVSGAGNVPRLTVQLADAFVRDLQPTR